ncbi:hypothetical protein FRC07_001058 [Ceratobasidium sp. 392]|nr:hypothetical protein FRC07_001058 [Ceratobasidium sp. 392]
MADQAIWLSHLKLAGLKPPRGSESLAEEEPSGDKVASSTPLPAFASQLQLTGSRPKPNERLAADKPGEELAPDAGIWQLYVEEAKEHDNELVDSRNKNLDVMLLFAALFSAIVTAFTVQSATLLQENPAEITVTLLLAIAQSQQRIEQGTPQNSSPIERPAFSAPLSARWINGLWFTALALSLSAALVAMLAKEWLTEFVASRPRPPQTYALLHQTRLKGLEKWIALRIIDFLPSILHLSLLLFALGLAVYLGTLNAGIMAAEAVISGVTVVFYLASTLSGVIFSSCPYVTQVSKNFQLAWSFLRRRGQTLRNQYAEHHANMDSKVTTDEQLQALAWLANNARDPAVSDCVYQALAGLAISIQQPSTPNPNEAPIVGDSTQATAGVDPNNQTTVLPQHIESQIQMPSSAGSNRYKLINGLFGEVCAHLSEAKIRHHRDLIAYQGLNVARYASALPELVRFLEPRPSDTNSDDRRVVLGLRGVSNSAAQSAFDALDCVWSDDCPEFSSDAYALLAAAELRLTVAVAYLRRTNPAPVPLASAGLSTNVIGMHTFERSDDDNGSASLFELQARYSRALARAAVLLSSHNDGRAPIGANPLAYMFGSIHLAAQCTALTSTPHMSTSLPQSKGQTSPTKFKVYMVGTGIIRQLPPLDIGDENAIIAGIMMVMSSPGIEETPWVELAAGCALTAVAPTLIHQWLNLVERSSLPLLNKREMKQALGDWPQELNLDQLGDLAETTLSQLLCLATIATSQAIRPDMSKLSNLAIMALYRRASMASGRYPMVSVALLNQGLFEELIRLVNLNHKAFKPTTLSTFLKLFLVERSGETLLLARTVSSTSLPTFLELLTRIPNHPLLIQSILTNVRQLSSKYSLDSGYLASFTTTEGGFAVLHKIGARPEYAPAVAELIEGIIEVAAGAVRSSALPSHASLTDNAIPGLLYSVKFLLEHSASDTKQQIKITRFMLNIIALLDRLDAKGLVMVAEDPLTAEIGTNLSAMPGSNVEHEWVKDSWDQLQAWVGVDDWHITGISRLFGAAEEVTQIGERKSYLAPFFIEIHYPLAL